MQKKKTTREKSLAPVESLHEHGQRAPISWSSGQFIKQMRLGGPYMHFAPDGFKHFVCFGYVGDILLLTRLRQLCSIKNLKWGLVIG